MDNVVQNIRLEDVIPTNYQSNDLAIIDELVESIKHFGILEPLLVRSQNGKYEIISGKKRYQAAKIIGLETIPVLIKNIDNEVLNQYQTITNKQTSPTTTNKFINLNPTPQESPHEIKKEKPKPIKKNIHKESIQSEFSNMIGNKNFNIDYNKNQPSDIVNLSELNKEEYERDDFKMNNDQINTNVMNNNFGVPTSNPTPSVQEPAFGGRFFPSLEDEPTNMNMGGLNLNLTPEPPIQTAPSNNLIDLTDLGLEKEPQIPTPQTFTTPEAIQSQMNRNQNIPEINSQPSINNSINMSQPNEMINSIPDPTNNIINIGNLQTNNPPVQPEPIGIENQFIGNIQNSAPLMDQPQNIPQFDMSQNIAPTEFIQNQEMNPMSNMKQSNFSLNPTNDFMMNQPEATPYVEPIIQQPVQGANMSTYTQTIETPVTSMPQNEFVAPMEVKDITPVINTLKSLATSLESFGYKININEEVLTTSIKLTIEVEK